MCKKTVVEDKILFELSDRLNMVAKQAIKCDLLVDVGTDHAYLPIYLHKKGVIKHAIAADISKGSCKKAFDNIEKYMCQNYIETRCGDGLTVINAEEQPDCVVIAGMGGMLAINVLKGNERVVSGVKRLVLQPQRDIDRVRRYLHSINFKIIFEDIIYEEGKWYNVISAEQGTDVAYSERDYRFGKILIDNKSAVLKSYIEYEKNKLVRAVISIGERDSEDIIKRKNEILAEIKSYEEVLECL